MNCLKCGREITGEGVFCPKCLEAMAAHPVRPNTVVVLPRNRTAAKRGVQRHRAEPTVEEKLRASRRQCRALGWTVAVLSVLLAASVALSVWFYSTRQRVPMGQNFTVVSSGAEP